MLYPSPWREPTPAATERQFAVGAVFATPLLADGLIVFRAADGFLYALEYVVSTRLVVTPPRLGGECEPHNASVIQRLPHVSQDVISVFQPGRDADQAFADAVARALLGRVGGMRHRRRVLRQRLGVAQADGAGDELQRVPEAPAGIHNALQLEGQHAAEARHLPAREFVLRKAPQTGVVDRIDTRVRGDQFGHRHRVVAMALQSRIKGIHAAMKSGMLAAEAAFEALVAERSRDELGAYPEAFRASWVHEELHKARNFKPLMKKGLWLGSLLFGMDQILFRGKAPWTLRHKTPDHAKLKPAADCPKIDYPKPDGVITFDRLSSVFLSSTNHEEDQPCHLRLKDDSVPIRTNLALYDAPEQRYCPAGVYEIVLDADGTNPRLQTGWEEQFQQMAEAQDDQLLDDELITTAWDEEEWEW